MKILWTKEQTEGTEREETSLVTEEEKGREEKKRVD